MAVQVREMGVGQALGSYVHPLRTICGCIRHLKRQVRRSLLPSVAGVIITPMKSKLADAFGRKLLGSDRKQALGVVQNQRRSRFNASSGSPPARRPPYRRSFPSLHWSSQP
jgi:hypothetical protein